MTKNNLKRNKRLRPVSNGMNKKTVLITGCAGFIGSNFSKQFRSQFSNFQMIGIDDLSSGRKEEIDTACQIAILNVDDGFSSSFITNLEPKIVVLYGDKKENAANLLGKGTLPATKKFTVTKDKLPEEMEVVVLG